MKPSTHEPTPNGCVIRVQRPKAFAKPSPGQRPGKPHPKTPFRPERADQTTGALGPPLQGGCTDRHTVFKSSTAMCIDFVVEGAQPGISRSKKVRVNPSIQRCDAPPSAARYARGNPPRSQRRSCSSTPVSTSENPETSTNGIRPANVSESPRIPPQATIAVKRSTTIRFTTLNQNLTQPRPAAPASQIFLSRSVRVSRMSGSAESVTTPSNGPNPQHHATTRSATGRQPTMPVSAPIPPPYMNPGRSQYLRIQSPPVLESPSICQSTRRDLRQLPHLTSTGWT